MARRYSPAELMALKTGWTIHGTARAPDLRMRRHAKNFLRKLGIYFPQTQHFRWETKVRREGYFRYDWRKSNRRFKYDWFKSGRTWPELHKLGKWDYLPSDSYHELVVGKARYRVIGGRLTRVGKPGKAKPPQVEEITRRRRVDTGIGPVYVPPNKWGKTVARVGLHRARQLDMIRAKATKSGDIDVLGGRVLPLKHHRKYWYFLRTKGYFRLSEHHPYGDEDQIFELP